MRIVSIWDNRTLFDAVNAPLPRKGDLDVESEVALAVTALTLKIFCKNGFARLPVDRIQVRAGLCRCSDRSQPRLGRPHCAYEAKSSPHGGT